MGTVGDQIDFSIGQRVASAGSLGTVRYIGEVQGQSGVWVGVEWDDTSRGKHNGSVDGVVYFQTSYATSGSFVRPSKLNRGISCVEAIQDRYGRKEGSTAGFDETLLEEVKQKLRIPIVEMVGFDKINAMQSQFEKLSVVSLNSELVRSPGEPGQLASLCPAIVQLDLSHTLISSWKTIKNIVIQLPHLVELDVSQNKIPPPSEEEAFEMKAAFKSLREIAIRNFGYSWKDLLTCAIMWPALVKLEAQCNKICELETPPSGLFPCLAYLSVQENSISEWQHIIKLGKMTSIKALDLEKTNLKIISIPDELDSTIFPSLSRLNLNRNEIDDWCSINELNKLPSLKSLKISSNPIMNRVHAFEMIVARVEGLQELNGCEVNSDIRKGAEYLYLRKFGSDWCLSQKQPNLSKEFQDLHPLYSRLIKKYGPFDEDELCTKTKSLKSQMINLTIFCPTDPNILPIHKRVPKNMTVQKLVGLTQKLMNTGCQVPRLHAISSKVSGVEVFLEKDMQDLSFYSVEDGDKIAVTW